MLADGRAGSHEHGRRESKESVVSGWLDDSCVYEKGREWNADFGRKFHHVGTGSRGCKEVSSKHSNIDLVSDVLPVGMLDTYAEMPIPRRYIENCEYYILN